MISLYAWYIISKRQGMHLLFSFSLNLCGILFPFNLLYPLRVYVTGTVTVAELQYHISRLATSITSSKIISPTMPRYFFTCMVAGAATADTLASSYILPMLESDLFLGYSHEVSGGSDLPKFARKFFILCLMSMRLLYYRSKCELIAVTSFLLLKRLVSFLLVALSNYI